MHSWGLGPAPGHTKYRYCLTWVFAWHSQQDWRSWIENAPENLRNLISLQSVLDIGTLVMLRELRSQRSCTSMYFATKWRSIWGPESSASHLSALWCRSQGVPALKTLVCMSQCLVPWLGFMFVFLGRVQSMCVCVNVCRCQRACWNQIPGKCFSWGGGLFDIFSWLDLNQKG